MSHLLIKRIPVIVQRRVRGFSCPKVTIIKMSRKLAAAFVAACSAAVTALEAVAAEDASILKLMQQALLAEM
jgi:hypothetical protein